MKKIIKYIIMVMMFISFVNKANAQKLVEGNYITSMYIKKTNDNGTRYMQARFINDGTSNHFVYCLEPFTLLDSNTNYETFTDNYETKLGLDEATINKIKAAIYFGYGYQTRTADRWYAITQLVIWRLVAPQSDIYFTRSLNGDRVTTYDSGIKDLLNVVNNYTSKPDFDNTTIKLNLNDIYTFDTGNYRVPEDDVMSNFATKQTITASKKLDKVYKYQVASENRSTLYYSNTSQKAFISYDPPLLNATLHLIITAGNLNINFNKSDLVYSNCSSDIKNSYGVYDDNNKLLDTIVVSDDKDYVSSDLPYGTYYIKQITNSCDIKKDNTVYKMVIDEDDENPVLDINLNEKINKINISKIYGHDNNYLEEENAVFSLSDDIKEYIVKTNNKGLASLEIGPGIYTLKQISGIKNYKFVDPVIVKISDKDLYYKFINEAIKKSINVVIKDENNELLPDQNICLYNSSKDLIKCNISNDVGEVLFDDLVIDEYYVKVDNDISFTNIDLIDDTTITLIRLLSKITEENNIIYDSIEIPDTSANLNYNYYFEYIYLKVKYEIF